MDNYNIILALLFVIILLVIHKGKSQKASDYFPLFASLSIFILFLLVFLVTDNYKRVLDQTTVNRVFTMCFVVVLFFTGMVLEKHDSKTS